MYEKYIQNGNRLPYGHVRELLNDFGGQYSWLSKNIINKAFIQYRKDVLTQQPVEKVDIPTMISLKSSSSSEGISTVSHSLDQSSKSRSVGRPVGSTAESKEKASRKLIKAKNEITHKFAAMKDSIKNGKRMRRGELEDIISQVKKREAFKKKSHLLLSDVE